MATVAYLPRTTTVDVEAESQLLRGTSVADQNEIDPGGYDDERTGDYQAFAGCPR